MASFEQAVAFVLSHEGGWANVSGDPGGLTRYGLSSTAYPDIDFGTLTLDEAKAIYEKDYWTPIRGLEIADQGVANKVLDMAVNMGVGTAVRILQGAVGAVVDGVVGPLTIGRTNAHDPALLLLELRAQSAVRYAQIAISNPGAQKFLVGWLRRAVS